MRCTGLLFRCTPWPPMSLVVRGYKELISMIYYFAYGSNLHPTRLMERVPSAEFIGVATHPSHRLTFHKKSNDGSSKCNMYNSGSETDLIYGAIYKLKPEHKDELDRFEGKGCGYIGQRGQARILFRTSRLVV